MSGGYGFVRFYDENDQQRTLSEIQGVYCGRYLLQSFVLFSWTNIQIYCPQLPCLMLWTPQTQQAYITKHDYPQQQQEITPF
ncbi:MAG: hypothetical protein M1834_006464 [Cirrosporium novae-zelandiae]|nr:MAG: hypothetical protein M1834_006464 [Cirrosporium novae-zelandiae]